MFIALRPARFSGLSSAIAQNQMLSLLLVDLSGRPAGLNVTYRFVPLAAIAAPAGAVWAGVGGAAPQLPNASGVYAVDAWLAAAGDFLLTVYRDSDQVMVGNDSASLAAGRQTPESAARRGDARHCVCQMCRPDQSVRSRLDTAAPLCGASTARAHPRFGLNIRAVSRTACE